jgi:hypothetical protein
MAVLATDVIRMALVERARDPDGSLMRTLHVPTRSLGLDPPHSVFEHGAKLGIANATPWGSQKKGPNPYSKGRILCGWGGLSSLAPRGRRMPEIPVDLEAHPELR